MQPNLQVNQFVATSEQRNTEAQKLTDTVLTLFIIHKAMTNILAKLCIYAFRR